MINGFGALNVQEQVSLKKFNTFQLDIYAKYFLATQCVDELILATKLSKEYALPLLILGGGSNMVLTQDFPGLVTQIGLRGIEKISETDGEVILKVAAGEKWDEFVQHALDLGYSGIENMSLIPGSVGAAPIQNIGAYGIELKNVFHGLEAIDRDNYQSVHFDSQACHFAYRNSIFKSSAKDRYIITAVMFKLSKIPKLHIAERLIEKELKDIGIDSPSPQNVRDIVCTIRRRRLPDPNIIGNAGSFFTNPFVTQAKFETILSDYPNLIAYPVDNQRMKISAGWLIDQCGWRGYRLGDAGVYEQNPLVLVNHGSATGKDILRLAHTIKTTVFKKFSIALEPEPLIY
jgi:UDP-N-acetylmuramate dehydrogenase